MLDETEQDVAAKMAAIREKRRIVRHPKGQPKGKRQAKTQAKTQLKGGRPISPDRDNNGARVCVRVRNPTGTFQYVPCCVGPMSFVFRVVT